MIIKVDNIDDANKCDELLTKLIQDESKYNNLINPNYKVEDYFNNIIKNDNNILLCYKEDNNIVGYVYFKPIENEDGKGYLIDGVYVEEEYRNKGIANSLINEGISLIKDSKFIDINLMADNQTARKLYTSLGFKDFRITMRQS